MSSQLIDLLVLLILFVVNGLFAMAEIAIISSRKTRLAQMAEEGSSGARAALKLVENPNRFLSTVQVGITLIGVFTGAFGGAAMAEDMAAVLRRIPLLASYAEPLGFIIIVVLITYLSLIVGELVPKRLAMNNPESTAVALAKVMRWVQKVTSPAVHFLSWSTDLVLRILNIEASEQAPISEEEIRYLIEQGTKLGIFEKAESEMVEGIFRFGDRLVSSLMTPRSEIDWLDLEDSPAEIGRTITESSRSRFPVCQGELDKVVGILRVKDILKFDLNTAEIADYRQVLQKPVFVPENLPALQVLKHFRASGTHLAMIIDEYGDVVGMVTLYDVLEAIVGEIPSKEDEEEKQATRRQDGSWLIDGMMPIEEFKALLEIDQLPGDSPAVYQTIGGFIMSQTQDIPSAGDKFTVDGWLYEVVDMDGKRVDKIIVKADPALQKTDPDAGE